MAKMTIFRLAAVLAAMLTGAGGAIAGNVLTYHGTPDRGGAYVVPTLTWSAAGSVKLDAAFAATVSGEIYAQPLFWTPQDATFGYLFVFTESNNVYALNGKTGAQVWMRNLGTPAVSGDLPCGNVSPSLGITGTPVIDPSTGTLYIDAMIKTATGPKHQVFGLSALTGAIQSGWPIDVHAALKAQSHIFETPQQGQRSGLVFAAGELFVAYGGMWGDCDPYRGWVLGFQTSPPALSASWKTRAARGGIWAQGGIALSHGLLYFTTGNTEGTSTWGDGEAVIGAGSGLAHQTTGTKYFFTPSNWHDLDNGDTDLGGTGPLPISVPIAGNPPKLDILQLGKDGNAYLLNAAALGGIGGQIAVTSVANGAIRSAGATYSTPTAAIVGFSSADGSNCPATQSGNMVALSIVSGAGTPITTPWCNSYNGNGSPIVTTTDGSSNPIFWVVGAEGDNKLHGFRGTDGAVLFGGGTTMSGLHHMQTLIYAGGRFYVAGDNKVYAFKF